MTHQPDLYALVVGLAATEHGMLPARFGHQAQGLFLDLVRQIDPALSARLHADTPTKSYTVAALAPGGQARGERVAIRRGEAVMMRVTLLESALFAPFVRALMDQSLHALLRLGSLPLALHDVRGTPESDPWAGFASFSELAQAAQPANRVTFEFATPTAWSLASAPGERKRVALLPEARAVFRSLLQRWNALAPEKLDEQMVEAAWEHTLVADYQLHTTSYILAKGSQVGFLGRCTYELHGTAEGRRALALLADAAFYLGVGMKTARGMGLVRRR